MNKSKFLKKSLAMLLALMLVVAMIPLSASASAINLESIYVDGNKVAVADEFTVDVYTTAESVEVGTNEDLSALTNNKHELRVAKPGSKDEDVIPKWDTSVPANPTGKELKFDDYLDEATQTITFRLYDMTTNADDGKLEATYVMKINKVTANTDTDLKSVTPGRGVYKILNTIDEINATKTIKVQLARHTAGTALNADIDIVTDKGATIGSAYTATSGTVPADDKDSFEIKSASGTNVSKFTVEATYLDAVETFSITGLDGKEYTGVITDGDDNDVPDTITVDLPDEAIQNTYGDTVEDPELVVNYKTNGNIESSVKYTYGAGDKTNAGNDKVPASATDIANLKTGGKIAFYDLGLASDEKVEGTLTFTRLPENDGAVQTYTLVVQMEKSNETAIQAVQVNNTMAADTTTDPITVELPKTWNDGHTNNAKTDPTKVKVTITTVASASKVTLDGQEATKGTPANGYVDWTFAKTSDLSKEKIVTVYAEDGKTMDQTGLVATVAEDVTSASITGFWLGNGSTRIPYKTIENNVITVEVPYMTLDVSGWTVYATPSAYCKATNGANTIDIMNGVTLASALGITGTIDVEDGLLVKDAVAAVSKNDDKIFSKYDVKIVLAPVAEGEELQGIDFTAQPVTNGSDKEVWRARTDANTFHANVDQATDGNRSVGQINLKIHPSLSSDNDLGVEFHNVVTSFQAEEGAVVYVVTDRKGIKQNNTLTLARLTCTTNDDSDVLHGLEIGKYTEAKHNAKYSVTAKTGDDYYAEIIVLPEEYARQLELGKYSGGKMKMSIKQAAEYGKLYKVVLDTSDASTEAKLETIKIGDVTLQINADNTITGTLPWSYTVPRDAVNSSYVLDSDYKDSGKFAEFSISDYARLTDLTTSYFSKGDTDGDGVEDKVDATPGTGWDSSNPYNYDGYNNFKFLFVQQPDHKIAVYRTDGTNAAPLNFGNTDKLKDNQIQVQAENRLNTPGVSTDMSATTYTFVLKYDEPSNETAISNFKLGDYQGSVVGQNITVNVPYGTDVTGLVATFDKSVGSTIRVNDRVGGVELVSGVTSVNYTNAVKLYVTSESKKNTVEYTVTVNQGLHFSDISESDWYYDNVMDAANNGYITGMGDGTFAPKKATTRAEFASMIAKAMGYTADPDVVSVFPDVADDFWGKAAINFCAQNGIISGYSDGTFQPNKAITRQEAAAILNNAFDLAEKFGTSSDLFSDDAKISGWAETHVYAAKASGLMKGDAAGTFRPTDTIIRAEAASILMNAKYEGLIK